MFFFHAKKLRLLLLQMSAGVHLFLGHVKLILIKSIEYEVLTSDEM